MKTLSFALIRRNLGTLALSGLILVGVAYYTFTLLPAKTRSLEGRYYRVLARIGLNLSQQLNAQRKAHEGIQWHLNREKTPPTEDAVRARWASDFSPGWPRPAFVSFQPLGAKAPKAAAGLEVRDGQLIVSEVLWPAGGGSGQRPTHRLQWAVPFDSVVGQLGRPDVFAYFFVVDARRRRVVYSSEPAALVLDSAALRPPRWVRDSSGVYTGTTAPVVLRGRAHHLFVTPLPLAGGGTWLLCGAVPQARFDAERQTVAGWTVELTLLVLVLGMLSLPFLKIAFMGARERLNREDVLRLGAALVLGLGLLLLGLQSLALRHWVEADVTRQQLQDLARDVSRRLGKEVGQLGVALRQADARLMSDPAYKALLAPPTAALPYWQLYDVGWGLLPAHRSLLTRQADSSDVLVWLDPGGHARLALGRKPIDYLTGLGGRNYFRAIAANPNPARYRADDYAPAATYLGSVVSFRNAQRTAVLARRSRWVADGSPAPTVCFLSTDLRCLRRPVLPPGFSFCVIDQRGEVLFHSNPRLSLSENLLADCEPADELQAALFTRDGQACEVRYQGRDSRLWVQPLAVAQPGLFLVTVADGDELRRWQLQTGLAALRLLVGCWLALGLLALLWHLLAPPLALSARIRSSFPRLWPRPDFAPHYWRIAGVHAVGVGLLYGVAGALSPLGQYVALLLLPLWLWGGTAALLRVKADGKLSLELSWLALAGTVLVLNLLAAYYLWWEDAGPLLAFQGLLAGAILLGYQLAGVADRRRWNPWLRARYRHAFSAMLLAWLVVLGAVPAVYCYQIANRAERTVQVRQAHLSLLRQLAAARVVVPADTLSRYLPFFAQTRLLNRLPADVTSRRTFWRSANERTNRTFYQWLHQDLGDENHSRVLPLANAGETGIPESLANADDTGIPEPIAGVSKVGSSAKDREPAGAAAAPPVALAGQWYTLPEKSGDASATRYFSQASDYGQPLRSEADALVSGTALFFATGAASAQAMPFFWLLPVGLLGLLALLAGLLHYLARACFLPAAATHAYPPQTPAPGPEPAAGMPVHRYIVTPTASTLEALPAALQTELANKKDDPLARISGRALAADAPADPTQWLAQQLWQRGKCRRVLFEEVDFHPEDAALTDAKRGVLEALLGAGKHVIILARCHPLALVYCDHPMEPPCDVPEHVRQRHAGLALLDALAYFRAEYLPLQTPPSGPSAALLPGVVPALELGPATTGEAALHRAVGEGIGRECDWLPFLQRQRGFVLAQARAAQRQHGRLPDAERVVDLVHRLAQFHYRSLWRRLGPEEQFYLYDLAQDGLVNPHNQHVMHTLLQKGYLRFNRHGRLLLFNDSFRQFAVSALQQRRVAAYEAQQRRGSTWAAWQLPLLLVLASGFLFVFVTQRAAMTGAEQLLTAFVTLLPLLARLLSSFGSPGSSKSEIRT